MVKTVQKMVLAVLLSVVSILVVATPIVPERVNVEGVIVRPESLTAWFKGWGGRGSYFDHVDDFIAGIKDTGVQILYIEFRAVDSAMNGTRGRQDMRGALYFQPDPAIPNTKVYRTDAPYNEDFSDPRYINYLIDEAHKVGLRVHAWFPTFNDRPLWEASDDYRTLPLSATDHGEESFVSPANSEVREHEKAIIRQILQRFNVQGLALDWIRYTQDDQPQSVAAQERYAARYGTDLLGPAQAGRNHSEWNQFLDFRAEQLSSFFAEVKQLTREIRPVELGGFMMPHSAKVGEGDVLSGQPWGYRAESWSGIDYQKIEEIGVAVMPMVYWDNQLNWKWPWNSWVQFIEKVNINVNDWISTTSGSRHAPVYSMAYPLSEMVEGFRVGQQQGTANYTLFFYGEWTKPWPSNKPDTKLDEIVRVLEQVNGEGVDNYPQVRAGQVHVSQGVATILATVHFSGQPGSVYASIDGGRPILMEKTSASSYRITGLSVSNLIRGKHSIVVTASDAQGRPGQDIVTFIL